MEAPHIKGSMSRKRQTQTRMKKQLSTAEGGTDPANNAGGGSNTSREDMAASNSTIQRYEVRCCGGVAGNQ